MTSLSRLLIKLLTGGEGRLQGAVVVDDAGKGKL